MCYTDADEELWQEDPYEYIRMKFGKNIYLVFCVWWCRPVMSKLGRKKEGYPQFHDKSEVSLNYVRYCLTNRRVHKDDSVGSVLAAKPDDQESQDIVLL